MMNFLDRTSKSGRLGCYQLVDVDLFAGYTIEFYCQNFIGFSKTNVVLIIYQIQFEMFKNNKISTYFTYLSTCISSTGYPFVYVPVNIVELSLLLETLKILVAYIV